MICFQIDNGFLLDTDKATMLFLQQYTIAVVASLFGGFKLTTDHIVARNGEQNTECVKTIQHHVFPVNFP